MSHTPLQQLIHNTVVQPALKERLHQIKAKIEEYDNENNRAKISFVNPFGPGRKTIDNVPLQLGSGGVHSAGPYPGDEVWVSFINGNVNFPRITSLADEAYRYRTRENMRHTRKGSLIPDYLSMG